MLLNQPKIIFLKLCCLILIFNIQYVSSVQPRVVCYYTNWSVYRPGTAKFNPQNINPYLCTHLIYAFGGFTKDNTLKPFDKYQDIEQGGYAKFTGLKTYNKDLKTLLAIGGWNEGSVRFSPLVANANRRQSFVKNVVKFLRQNRFDGLDLDWEYPAFRDGGKPRDRDNYAKLVQELRDEFERESSKTQRPRLLLTMAVPAGFEYIEKGYDVPKLNQYLDWFNLLSYDYHSAYEPSVNHHSPLYGENEDDEYNYDVDLNINATINYYLNAGAEREKLVLGIPTYGRSYTLFNSDSHEIGSPADGPGEQGDATREKGYLSYYEICQNVNDPENGWTVVQQDPEKYGPYAYSDNQWVGYDDEDIVRKKSKFVVEQDLGGIMFWSIDNDDFRGLCGGKPYPLIEAAKESLLHYIENGKNSVPSTRNRISGPTKTRVQEEAVISSKPTRRTNQRTRTTTPTTTTTTKRTTVESINFKTTTPAPPTTPDQGSDFKCEEEGFFEHPRDCKKYFWCLETAELGIVAHSFTCPSGLYFNKLADSCDYARNVLCNKSKSTTTTSTTTSTTTNKPTTSVYDRNVETSSYRNPLFARTSTTTTTTTTTPAYEEYEYDLDDEDVEDGHLEQEDPKVIKELINLIKKVGGLDELEKQLKLSDDSYEVVEQPKKTDVLTTPPTIKKSLYERVLQRANQNKNRFNGGTQSLLSTIKDTIKTDDDNSKNDNNKPKYETVRNRSGPQNVGLDKLPEFEGFLKEKPQYVTITRTKLSSANDQNEEDEDDEENDSDENNEEYEVEEAPKRKLNENKYQYTDIRRNRPNQVIQKSEEESDEDVEDTTTIRSRQPSYVQSSRQRTTSPEEVTTSAPSNIPSRSTFSRYQTFSRQRYSTQKPSTIDENETVIDDDSESVGTTEKAPNSVSSIVSNLLQNTPEYKTIDRKKSTTSTATTQDPTILKESIPKTSFQFTNPNDFDLFSDSFDTTENIIPDSTEQVTVTEIPLSFNEIYTEQTIPPNEELIISPLPEKPSVIETGSDPKTDNNLSYSSVNAPRPFSRPNPTIRRVTYRTSTTESPILVDSNDNDEVSLNSQNREFPSRNQIKTYSTLSPRTRTRPRYTERPRTEITDAEERITRTYVDRGRGTARFRARPTKSGIYDKSLNAAGEAIVNEQLINDNRLRAINFNRDNNRNTIEEQKPNNDAFVYTKEDIPEDSKIHKIKINDTIGRPDRYVFELTAGKKIAFGFSTKRPQSKAIDTSASRLNQDSPIVRVITGPLNKSPISRKQGIVEEVPLLKTTTKTINLKEPTVNITSYSDKQKITEDQDSTEITTEIPSVETTTFISAAKGNDEEDDTTFNPNVENVQSEGDTGFIPRLNNTTRRRPFIARRTSPVAVTTTTETPTTTRQRVFQPISRKPTPSAKISDSVARETEDSRPTLIEGNRVVTRQRQRPRITGYRNRQNSAAESSSREFSSTSAQTESPTTRSRFRYTPSKAGISIKETFDITSDEEDFSNIILSDDFDGTTESIYETTNQASGENVGIETTTSTVFVSETSTRAPTRFATRRTIASRRRIVPTQETSERPEEPSTRSQLINRNRFAIRNQSRRPILGVLKTESPERGDSNALTTPDDKDSDENDDSSVSETTERIYTVPIDGEESTENDATESTKSEEVDTTRPVEIEPVRKRVKVYRQRTKPAQQEEEGEVRSVKPAEPTSTQPPTRVRKTKIIRRPFKTAAPEENDEEQPAAPSVPVSTTKTPRTRIIRRKKVKAEDVEEEITTTTTQRPASRRRVLKVLKKNVTESTTTTEETASEPTGFTRPSRPSRISYVRKINTNNENTVAVRRTLVRRPITSTTTTEPTIELHEDDEEREESHEDTKDVDDEPEHHEEAEEENVEHHSGEHSEEKVEDDVDESDDEVVQRPAPRYTTRPSFSVRGPPTARRVPFPGNTRQTTVHPASTRFLSTQGGNLQTTKARRVTIRKQFVGSGLRKSTKAPTTATTSISTSAPLNTFTPIPYTEDSFITTTDYNEDFDHTELINNNENILQDLEERVTGKKKGNLSTSSRYTTTAKPTTLYHVFAELPNDKKASEDNVNLIDNNAEEIIKKLEKLIEINRVVEISGKEEIRKLSKNRKVKKIDIGSLMLLQPPTLNKVGEFSKLTLVKVAKVPESTEAPVVTADGRAQKSLFAETVFNTETSTISLEGLFDNERDKKSFDGDDQYEASTVPQTDSLDETTESFISANKKESEVDPLVISITNLDKIKLSKVQSDETTTYKPSPVFIASANIENDQAESNKVNVLLNSNSEIENKKILTTITKPSSNNYHSRFTKRKQSPEVSKTNYSANRRGTTTTTTSAPIETTTENVRKFQRKSPNTFRKGSFTGLRNKTSRNNQTEASTTVETQTVSNPFHRRRVSTALYRKPVTTSTKIVENFETTTPVQQRSSLLKFKANDQGTESSVATVQKNTNQLNQDADSLEEIARALQSISNAPFREETTKHSFRKYEKTPLPKNHKLEGELYRLPENSATQHRQYFEEVVIPNFNNTSHRNNNQNPSTFDKIIKSNNLFTQSTISTIKPYDKLSDYYDDDEEMIIRKLNSQVKVIIHSDGKIECLDGAGSFPHPFDCKKFIQCGHTNSKKLIGWVFSCPQNLSYDPVGRICNWNFACKM